METEEVRPSSGLRKGLLVFQPFFTVMGTVLSLCLFSQLLSSWSSLSTDILRVSANLLVWTDLAGVISSVNGNSNSENIFTLKPFYLFESSLPSTHRDPLLVLKEGNNRQ